MTKTTTPSAAPASHRLRADLDRLREEGEAAEAEIIRLRRLRPDVLRNGTDAEVERHDAEAAKHNRTVERTTARAEVLAADLKVAQHAEDQGERRAAYEAAIGASAEVERILREVYEPAADVIRQTLERVAELRAVVDAANDRLPEGVAYVPDVESFRQVPHTGPTRRRYEEVRYFDREGGNQVNPMFHLAPDGSFAKHIEARTVTVETIDPAPVGYTRPSLCTAVCLPSLSPHGPSIWPA